MVRKKMNNDAFIIYILFFCICFFFKIINSLNRYSKQNMFKQMDLYMFHMNLEIQKCNKTKKTEKFHEKALRHI